MMKHLRIIIFLSILMMGTVILPIAAQTAATCSALVERALATVATVCSSTDRNQACYGNNAMTVTVRPQAPTVRFENVGDLANLSDIDSLRLNRLDDVNGMWGVALMKVQANLPDILPGQNVTFLLFGDTEIQNTVSDQALAAGTQTAMQAFYLRNGISATDCADVPEDGILIQTPSGMGEIHLTANEIDLRLGAEVQAAPITGSTRHVDPGAYLRIAAPRAVPKDAKLQTATPPLTLFGGGGATTYIRATPGKTIQIAMLSGAGEITINEVTVAIPSGNFVEVPIDEAMKVAGAPSEAQPYDAASLNNLPLELLPEAITITDLNAPEATDDPEDSGDDGDIDTQRMIGTLDSVGADGLVINGIDFDTSFLESDLSAFEPGMLVEVSFVWWQSTLYALTLEEIQTDSTSFWEGTIDALGDGFIVVNGEPIDISQASIEGELALNAYVEIEFNLINGDWIAVRVRVLSDSSGDEETRYLQGTLEAVGDGFIVVDSEQIDTTQAEIVGDIVVGTIVEVEFNRSGEDWIAVRVRVVSDDEGEMVSFWEGTIDEIGDGFLVVDGEQIDISQAEIEGVPEVGKRVEIEFHYVNGDWITVRVRVLADEDDTEDPGDIDPTPTEDPGSIDPTPTEDPSSINPTPT